MAIIKTSKLRESADAELQAKFVEFLRELNSERGMVAGGGRTSNPGKIKELKRGVARILTIQHERKLGIIRGKAAAVPSKIAANAVKKDEAKK